MARPLSAPPPRSLTVRRLCLAGGCLILFVALGLADVPTDVKMPGTQPGPESEALGLPMPPAIDSVGNCNCHDFSGVNRDPEGHPTFGWSGAMMANSGRDPLFWSTLAIAEQDFLPGSGGVGDLCIRCHSLHGWLEGRSTATNGAALVGSTDQEGIMCHFCHQLVNPDQANSLPGVPAADYAEAHGGDFVAYDETSGEGHYGAAQYVLNGEGERLGPYTDHVAKHKAYGSPYFRDSRFCATCHDVSNPATGDLAHNNGAMTPLEAGFSGTPGTPVSEKAAFNNKPHMFGIVERTYSEWKSSAFEDLQVASFPSLPSDLRVSGGSLDRAYQRSLWGNCSATTATYCNTDVDCPGGETCLIPADNVNYEDGTVRLFSCQTCHMSASIAVAASNAKVSGQFVFRPDHARHDQTGGSYWIQEAIRWQDEHGTLRFGGGLTWPNPEMDAARVRAGEHLQSAASLSATQDGSSLRVRVTNLTGHKLITGYPEGRRMFLNLKWFDGSTLVEENGAYGPLGNMVSDLGGTPWNVESILDFDSTKIYEAKPGISRGWAKQLRDLGYPSSFVVEWDRMTNLPKHDLGEVAAWPTAEGEHTFHFVLNNWVIADNRIPPYGFSYEEASERNALPVPESQYGDPGEGGTYNHWDEVLFPIPVGATSVEVRLYYQSTSWEYVQFLWLQNDGSDDPAPPLGDDFLGNEGVNMLDAWLNTGMSAPFEMALVSTSGLTAPSTNPPGAAELMTVTGYDAGTGEISVSYAPACDAADHTIHYGRLADVSTHGWAGAACGLGTSGSAAFVPDPAAGDSIFWVIAGNSVDWEGGYGAASDGTQRPPNIASAGSCFRTQSVRNFCE